MFAAHASTARTWANLDMVDVRFVHSLLLTVERMQLLQNSSKSMVSMYSPIKVSSIQTSQLDVMSVMIMSKDRSISVQPSRLGGMAINNERGMITGAQAPVIKPYMREDQK
jgi:hypothetical protein